MKKLYLIFFIFSNFIMAELYATENFKIENLTEEKIANMAKANILMIPYIYDPHRLRELTVSYYDFDGNMHNDGRIVVLDGAAEQTISIFKNLYKKKFSINQIKPIDEFSSNDTLAMEANNTSSLNQRPITNQTNLSIHSYGLAIDVNPVQNPYVYFDFDNGVATYVPIIGAEFANRREDRPGKPHRQGLAEPIKKIFYQNGFNIWGGNWDYPIDYQHFQTSSELAQLLVVMDEADAKKFFKLHIKFLRSQKENDEDELAIYMQDNIYPDLITGYLKNKEKFMYDAKKIAAQKKLKALN